MPEPPAVERTVAEGLLEGPGGMPVSTLDALSRGELDVQITTARRYPRSLSHFRADAAAMVRLDQETAASCFYALPRRQKQEDGSFKRITITGPSIRLAEIVAIAWGNLRAGARIVVETERDAVAQGFCHDLQTNYAIVTETRRRLVDRNGQRYSDDLIVMTENAACTIARRNAIFAVVPRVYINQLVEIAKGVAAGDLKALGETRKRLVAEFAALGVSAPVLCGKLERPGVEDFDLEDVRLLHGLLTAIREGTTSVAVEFARDEPESAADQPKATTILADTLRQRRARRTADGPATTEPAKTEPAPPGTPGDEPPEP